MLLRTGQARSILRKINLALLLEFLIYVCILHRCLRRMHVLPDSGSGGFVFEHLNMDRWRPKWMAPFQGRTRCHEKCKGLWGSSTGGNRMVGRSNPPIIG